MINPIHNYFSMNLCISYMIYFDKIEVSEGTDINKTSASKECDICHYWYVLNYSFKFQPNVCNRCIIDECIFY